MGAREKRGRKPTDIGARNEAGAMTHDSIALTGAPGLGNLDPLDRAARPGVHLKWSPRQGAGRGASDSIVKSP
jgi:hypothetical protein